MARISNVNIERKLDGKNCMFPESANWLVNKAGKITNGARVNLTKFSGQVYLTKHEPATYSIKIIRPIPLNLGCIVYSHNVIVHHHEKKHINCHETSKEEKKKRNEM